MELRHLRYFVAIYEHGSVNAAAQALHIAQPSLSRQLRQLERELGLELFTRIGGRLTPSPAGRALVGDARSLLAQADQLQRAAEFHASGGLHRVRVGAPTVTLTDIVAPFVATFEANDPDVDVLATEGLAARAALDRGVDLVISAHAIDPSLTFLPLPTLPVWAYVAAQHPWAERERVPLTELAGADLIVLPVTTTARQALDQALASIRALPQSNSEVANGTLAQALAAAGRGVAVVSDDPRFGLRRSAIETGTGLLTIRLHATWDPAHPAATHLAEIAKRMRDFIAARYV